jgi:hypothetical protein
MSSNKEQLIDGLYADVVGNDELVVSKDAIVDSISDILHQYNLSTDMSFIEKITTMKFDKKSESIDLSGMPQDLQNAAYLPVNTIADIALRQDLDMLISQIPEWFTALQITRDAVCESDVVTGRLARSITFDRTSMDNLDKDNVISKIEEVEERLELHQLIKNHVVFNTLEHGEGYLYVVPDAKVFEDLYKYRTNSANMKSNSAINTFDTSSSLLNGYGESAVEISLNDTIINDSSTSNDKIKKMHKNGIFTEAEIIEMRPSYHMKPMNDESKELKSKEEEDDAFDRTIEEIAKNISCITEDISLPVIEESAHDLRYVYYNKYRNDQECVQEVKTFFEQVMDSSTNDSCISNNFKNVKGVYLRILPATKLIPIRVDRNIIGYYYISDMTRPEQSGERKNSGLSGYTLRSPSIGFDTFQPDQMFCEKLANKIINNFNMKFMRDNTALHKQIVAILQSHKFNEQMLRFIFIPAEYVIQFAINKDGMGKGHSMLEPGIVTARMYMFLKLYSLLYQINNSQVRVYNLRMSGIDKNYRQFVQETMRKFAARRVTANDIFNYRSSMTKVSGGSELIMPLGAGDQPPITVDSINAAESPISNDLLDSLKNESINSTPVPSLMVQTGGQSEIEFAKETELANTRFNTLISSCKLDFNPDITKLYRIIMRWETDIDPGILQHMKFCLRMPTAKQLNVTSEMINNFNALSELLINTCLSKEETKGGSGTEGEPANDIVREYKKLLIAEYIPQIDIDRFDELADKARSIANERKLKKIDKQENLVNDTLANDEEAL